MQLVAQTTFGGRPIQASERSIAEILELTDGDVKISFSDQSIYFDGV